MRDKFSAFLFSYHVSGFVSLGKLSMVFMRRCAVGCCSVWDASQYMVGLLLLSTLIWHVLQHKEQFS